MNIIISSKNTWNIYNFRKNLIINFLKNKHKVFIFSNRDNYSSKLESLGCKVINIPFDNRGFNLFKDIYVLLKFFIYALSINPSVFLSFNIKPIIFTGFISRIFFKKNIFMITGLGTAFLKNGILKNIAIFLYKVSIKKNDCIFFQNQEDHDFFLNQKISINVENYILPGSGVDLNKFYYNTYYEDKNLSFLFIGRILKSKGINEYLTTSLILKKKYPNFNFNIVGSMITDSKDCVDKILLEKLINDGVVNYLGYKNDIRDLIIDSDCIVLPSYREGTPKSLLESLALGRPIITSDSVGCKDVVVDNFNGFICKRKNSHSLESAMLKFIKLPYLKRKNMSLFGRKFVENKYDENIVINKYLILINKINN